MLIKKAIIFFCVFYQAVAFSQNVSKQIKKAENSSKNYSYVNTIEIYEGILRKTKGVSEEELQRVKLNLAEAYFFVKDYNNAEKYYNEVLKSSPALKGEDLKAYKRYAQVLSGNGKHGESAQVWKKFTELQEQDKRGIEFSKLYANLEPLTRNSNSYRIEYVGINTASPDFSPAFYKDGLVFVSSRNKNNAVKRVFKWDNSTFLDLYYLEDLKILGKEESNASIGSGGQNSGATKPKTAPDKLGSDYYTPPTPNDANTIGHTGSELINGSKNYEEQSIIDVKKFSKNLNSKYHEGPCTFFHSGERILFTRNAIGGGGIFGQKKEGVTRLKIYSAIKTGKDWSEIKELPFNSDDFSCGHPTMSFNDDILFFVSDMPGGYGGTDIYASRLVNGEWQKPVNLGGTINTIGNEMFPFIDEGNGLYFSSDGHPGLGELDMFYCKVDVKTLASIGKIRNLGAPLNSNNDDFGIITDPNRNLGYFSSNRKRGGADDDIYKFTRIGAAYGCRDLIVSVNDADSRMPIEKVKFEYKLVSGKGPVENVTTNAAGTVKLCLEADQSFKFKFESEGYIFQEEEFSNIDASDFEPSRIEIYLKKEVVVLKEEPEEDSKPKKQRVLVQKRTTTDNTSNVFRGVISGGENDEPMSAVKVKFINKCTGEVQEMYTKKDGSYEFRRDLNCDYELVATKDDFGTSSEIIEKAVKKTLFGKKIKPTFSLNLFDTKLYKVGDVIKLESIYYSSDQYKLRDYSKRDLDKLIATMKRYPNMIIEISSHTDTRGNAWDNLRLSQKRAQEVEKYILSKGISKQRIKAIGKGETEPLNECSDGVQCTEAEHQRNRRTEFKILTIEKN